MATIPIATPQAPKMPNPLAQNAGKPVLGNTGVANPNDVPGAPKPNPQTAPLQSAAVQAQQSAAQLSPPPAPPNIPGLPAPPTLPGTPSSPTSPTGGTGTPATPSNPITAGYTPEQQQQLQKQLIDIYGKGEGGLLFSTINGLGSSNTAYMAAYEKAMAPLNAENLATLNTTLGNSGVGANSSTFAIANADFESNITSQEGLQEQQLQQQDSQDLINITQNLEGAAEKENSTSWYGDLGDVLSGVGNFVSGIIPFASGAHNATQGAQAQQTINNGGTSSRGNANNIPTNDDDPSTMPGVSADDTSTSLAGSSMDDFLF